MTPVPSLGSFVVTYHRPEPLRASLEALITQTRPPDLLLVVDNGRDQEAERLVKAYDKDQIRYEASPDNLGSAGGTWLGTTRLAELGLDLIHSGDDDNPLESTTTLERLVTLLNSAAADVGGVGVVGARFDWRRGSLVRIADEELHGPLEVDFIGGNHHLILRREAVERAGAPNRDLFFGYPDLEHCLRIRRAGFRLVVDGDLMRTYREMFGRTGSVQERSAVPRRNLSGIWRNYYTTRNYIHMMRRTFGHPELARRQVAKVSLRCIAAWSRGPAYGATFARLQMRAVLDGYRGVLGRTVSPQNKSQAE
jgi:glycosyltransferase involved in cell wall biosynthesis